MKTKHIQKIVFSATFASLVFAATWISVPNGLGGNVNLGDSMLLLCAWTLGGPWGILACAIGSMLTDLLGAYAIYAPATFVIKALMCAVAILVAHLCRRMPRVVRCLLSGIAAEGVMVLGYFAYEWALFSLPVAAVGIPFNLIQGAASILVASLLHLLLSKARLDQLMK